MILVHTLEFSYMTKDRKDIELCCNQRSIVLDAPFSTKGEWSCAFAWMTEDMESPELAALVGKAFKDRKKVFPQDPCTVASALLMNTRQYRLDHSTLIIQHFR